MNRTTVMRILLVVAIAAVALIGWNMLQGRPDAALFEMFALIVLTIALLRLTR